jgi:hypothetical protein
MAFDQATIFKAYDVRGIVPGELDADLAFPATHWPGR